MKKLWPSFILTLFFAIAASAQAGPPISVIDFVKIKNGRTQEAMYYYENNWKAYRESALKQGYIRSYKILRIQSDSSSDFDLLLMTEYASADDFKQSESRFQAIIKTLSPSGPKLLNSILPPDFRQTVSSKTFEAVLADSR